MNPGRSLGIRTPNLPGREGKTRTRDPDPVGSRSSSRTSPALPRSSSPRWMSRARRSRRAGGCRTRSSLRPFPIPRIPAPPRRSRDPCPAASTFPRGWRLFRAAIPGISPPSRGSSAGRFPPGSWRSRTPSVEGGVGGDPAGFSGRFLRLFRGNSRCFFRLSRSRKGDAAVEMDEMVAAMVLTSLSCSPAVPGDGGGPRECPPFPGNPARNPGTRSSPRGWECLGMSGIVRSRNR